MAIDKITGQGITEGVVLEGTHIVVPSGTTAQRPSGPENGYVRYNTTLGSLEFYNGSDGNWVSTNLIPTISSLTGNINDTYEATLKFETTNATDSVTIVFRNSSNVELAEVTDVVTNTQPFYVDIPSSVTSAVSSGDTVKVIVQNQDGTPSDSVTKTVIAAPSGGTINTYTEGGSAYRSHTFTSSDSFTQSENLLVNALLVGGGGGGAAGGGEPSGVEAGGGGGAGGMYTYTTTFYSSDSPRNVTVGAGGAGREGGTKGNTGGNGVASNIQSDLQAQSIGGGGGGHQGIDGNDGGSGGGSGGTDSDDSPPLDGGSGTSGQGNAGGGTTQVSGDMGSGGGGASAAGVSATVASGGGGSGGDGSPNTYKDGTTDYYAGGGGGGDNTDGSANGAGAGGQGGGGDGNTGTSGSGSNGTANTGGGGGGGYGGSGNFGGNGGSGIVIIRYKTDQVSA